MASSASIAWLNVCIHHPDSTPLKCSKMIIVSTCTSSTGPAKLVLAEGTSHMIATCIFLYLRAAHRAERYVTFVFFCPPFQLFRHSFLASDIFSMPRITAIKADLSRALWALQLFHFVVFSSHEWLTIRFSAPTNQRIRLDWLFVLESIILLKQLFLAMVGQNLRKSCLVNFRLGAFGVKALDLVDVSPFNLQLEHLYGALATEAMFAVELNCQFVFGG